MLKLGQASNKEVQVIGFHSQGEEKQQEQGRDGGKTQESSEYI